VPAENPLAVALAEYMASPSAVDRAANRRAVAVDFRVERLWYACSGLALFMLIRPVSEEVGDRMFVCEQCKELVADPKPWIGGRWFFIMKQCPRGHPATSDSAMMTFGFTFIVSVLVVVVAGLWFTEFPRIAHVGSIALLVFLVIGIVAFGVAAIYYSRKPAPVNRLKQSSIGGAIGFLATLGVAFCSS
jgi:hypothetical protein